LLDDILLAVLNILGVIMIATEKFQADLGEAIDLSHHLSELSKSRDVSPLKGLHKYFEKPGLLSLVGG